MVGSGPTFSESESGIEGHIRQAQQAVFSHVESFGCADLDLKLRILDWKTRVMELEMMNEAEELCMYVERRLTEMVHEAREDVIARIRQERCTDIELRIKVLDLETRVVEKNKMLEGTVP